MSREWDELARLLAGRASSRAWSKGTSLARFGKRELLEALGLREAGTADWIGPVFVGFGVGAIVGATVALALAPRPGNELRGQLYERGKQVLGRARERIESERSTSSQTPAR